MLTIPVLVKRKTNENGVYFRYGPVVREVWTGLSPRVEQQDRKFLQVCRAVSGVWRTRLPAGSGVF